MDLERIAGRRLELDCVSFAQRRHPGGREGNVIGWRSRLDGLSRGDFRLWLDRPFLPLGDVTPGAGEPCYEQEPFPAAHLMDQCQGSYGCFSGPTNSVLAVAAASFVAHPDAVQSFSIVLREVPATTHTAPNGRSGRRGAATQFERTRDSRHPAAASTPRNTPRSGNERLLLYRSRCQSEAVRRPSSASVASRAGGQRNLHFSVVGDRAGSEVTSRVHFALGLG
jgi:hypothetical protein